MTKIRFHPAELHDASDKYAEEISFLANEHQCSHACIVIDDNHCSGDTVVFIYGKWAGYLDEAFYEKMHGD